MSLIGLLLFSVRIWSSFLGIDAPTAATCGAQEWRCVDGVFCISKKWICDGYVDCYDHSDENNCPSTTTTQSTTTTTTTATTTTAPTTRTTTTSTTTATIPTTRTTAIACQPTEISCSRDGVCLPRSRLCNGVADCSDRSDESGCTVSQARTPPPLPPTSPPPSAPSPPPLPPTSPPSAPSPTDAATSRSVRTTPKLPTTENASAETRSTTTSTTTTTSSPTTTTTAASLTKTTAATLISTPTTTATTATTTKLTTTKYLASTPAWLYPQTGCFVGGGFNCSGVGAGGGGGGQCVDSAYVCDGAEDCVDASDERSCRPGQLKNSSSYLLLTRPLPTTGPSYCTSNQFQCNTTTVAGGNQVQKQVRCIPAKWVCDGDNDCGDGSDETNCPGCQRMPEDKRFVCASGGQCVSRAVRCNGRSDCQDASDERACWCDARRSKVRCNDTSCVNVRLWCNGHADCANNADEMWCSDSDACPDGAFRCGHLANNAGVCLPPSYECNGIIDCPDYSDEANCSCSSLFGYRCDMGYCVNTGSWCDGVIDCPDGSDEKAGCETQCPPNQFTCAADGTCISPAEVCDWTNTCGDWSDEIGCECASFEQRCDMGICLDLRHWCNGHPDCPDGSDERHGCPQLPSSRATTTTH